MASGYVTQIIGPVIDIRFLKQEVPAIHEAVEIRGDNSLTVVEVMQQRGDGVVRCVSFSPTEGLMRGMEAIATGSPLKVPVGEEIAGRLFNVLGEPIDSAGPVTAADHCRSTEAPSSQTSFLKRIF